MKPNLGRGAGFLPESRHGDRNPKAGAGRGSLDAGAYIGSDPVDLQNPIRALWNSMNYCSAMSGASRLADLLLSFLPLARKEPIRPNREQHGITYGEPMELGNGYRYTA